MRHFATSDAVSGLISTETSLTHNSAPRVSAFRLNTHFTHIQRFLDILAGGKGVTFQTFSDRDELRVTKPNGDSYDPNARWRHGTLKELEPYLKHMNAKGAGVHAMVNKGDSRGRAAKNVIEVRALFIDTDGVPLPAHIPLKPHLMVQSSPGKYHLYWKVDGLELSSFSTLQQALAEHYGTDPAVHDLARVMRLPGFYHRKGEPVMVQLLEAHDHPPYRPADIFKAWSYLAKRLEHNRALEAEHERQRAQIVRRAAERRMARVDITNDHAQAQRLLQVHHDTVASAVDGTRHDTLLRSARALGGYVASGYLELHEVEDVLRAAADVCGLPDAEAADVIRWGLNKGSEKPLELNTTSNTPSKTHIAFASGKRKRLAEWYK